MPILTFPLALSLTTCFVAGSIVTWVLGERRRRMEREETERQMTRALQTRYEVYEGLEQTVIKLVTKFDAMESEFKQRLGQGSNIRSSGERSVRVRSSNPELWDMEREHHRVSSEQLAEIARRSVRITELMEQLQALELDKSKLESELESLKHRYDNAIANAAEFEQVSNIKVERLQARVCELEPLGSLLEAAQRDLAEARSARAQSEQAATAMQERLAQLEDAVARREAEVGEQTLRVLELEGEFSGAKQALATQSARRAELETQAKAAQQELANVKAQLDTERSSHAVLSKDLEAARQELAQALQRCEIYTNDLTKARAALDEARGQALSTQKALEESKSRLAQLESELAEARSQAQALSTDLERGRAELVLHRAKLAAHSSHVVEAWSVLSELKPMLETLEQKLKDTEGPAAALPKSPSAGATNPAATTN